MVNNLLTKLPDDGRQKEPSSEVVVNICGVLNNLVTGSSLAARDITYFDGLPKLVGIKSTHDNRWAVCKVAVGYTYCTSKMCYTLIQAFAHLHDIWCWMLHKVLQHISLHTRLFVPSVDLGLIFFSSSAKMKAAKAAATVLSNMFQYKKLHKSYKEVRGRRND